MADFLSSPRKVTAPSKALLVERQQSEQSGLRSPAKLPAVVPSTTPSPSNGRQTPPKPMPLSVIEGNSPNSAASSPAGQDTKLGKGLRGDNAFKRKWNPRIAAQQRREREAALQTQQKADGAPAAKRTDASAEEAEARARAQEVKHCSHEDPLAGEHSSERSAGFSLARPIGRGPEHKPGAREQQRLAAEVQALNTTKEDSAASPNQLRRGGQPTVAPPASGPGRPQWAADQDLNSYDQMDFGQLQKLISAEMASSEINGVGDLDLPVERSPRARGVDASPLLASSPRTNARGRSTSRTPVAFAPQAPANNTGNRSTSRTPQPPPAREFGARGAESRGISQSRGESPRNQIWKRRPVDSEEEPAGAMDAGASSSAGFSMAAPAEYARGHTPSNKFASQQQRAIQQPEIREPAAEQSIPSFSDGREQVDVELDSPPRINDIRAIAERRAQGFQRASGSTTPGTRTPRGSGTPRAVTPRGESMERDGMTRTPTPRGVYKPNHVYGSRSSDRGERLASSLGLKFGIHPIDTC